MKYIVELETEKLDSGLDRVVSLSVNGTELMPCDYRFVGFIADQIISKANMLASDCDEYKAFCNHILKTRNGAKDIGYCYLMIDHNTGYFKIGRSLAPYDRERTLQSEKPTIEMILKWEGGPKEEAKWHRRFSKKRIRGEWFDLNEFDVKEIKRETTEINTHEQD